MELKAGIPGTDDVSCTKRTRRLAEDEPPHRRTRRTAAEAADRIRALEPAGITRAPEQLVPHEEVSGLAAVRNAIFVRDGVLDESLQAQDGGGRGR